MHCRVSFFNIWRDSIDFNRYRCTWVAWPSVWAKITWIIQLISMLRHTYFYIQLISMVLHQITSNNHFILVLTRNTLSYVIDIDANPKWHRICNWCRCYSELTYDIHLISMETFSALLAICAGNSPVPGEFPTQRPVTRSFDVYFDLRPNNRLSKQLWGWWFETQSRPLWRHRNDSRYFGPDFTEVCPQGSLCVLLCCCRTDGLGCCNYIKLWLSEFIPRLHRNSIMYNDAVKPLVWGALNLFRRR